MTKYSKYNIVYRLQKWMDSVPGQTFLNYAYSWGASIVIAGTLFKLTHLPGANLMLFIGMGTEVVVFFLSAFDRPFDKTSIGMDLQTHYNGEEEQSLEGSEAGLLENGESEPSYFGGDENEEENGIAQVGTAVPQQPGTVIGGGGTIIIGGGGTGGAVPVEGQESQGGMVAAMSGGIPQGEGEAPMGGGVLPQGGVSTAWVAQQQQVSPEMAEATESYVDELKRLTEMLGKVNEQSARLSRDSEEMENLNRTLTGITKVYEMQLKSASQQIGTIDQINEQSKKMAQQIEHLNQIYARMIEAMTVNMRTTTPVQNNDPIV